MTFEEYTKLLIDEFGAETYRIKRDGVVIKFVRKGMEVEISENKKDATQDTK